MYNIRRKGISAVPIELIIILVCFTFSETCNAVEGFRWIDANAYRLVVSVIPGRLQWKTTPVSVDMDLQEIEKTHGFPAARIDINSIRVVAHDAQGQILLYNSKKTGRERF